MYKPRRPRFGQFFTLLSVLAVSSVAAVGQDSAPTQAKPAAAKKASIYNQTADTQAQVGKATAQAKRENKRIVVMFGGDWCGWCH